MNILSLLEARARSVDTIAANVAVAAEIINSFESFAEDISDSDYIVEIDESAYGELSEY